MRIDAKMLATKPQSSTLCGPQLKNSPDISPKATIPTSSSVTSTESKDSGSDESSVGISQPHGHDVLCGRGVTTNRHKGNEKFRDFVDEKKDEYVKSSKRMKNQISKSIVHHVRNLDPPGRFLEKNVDDGLWYDIGDKKAGEKTAQALRDRAANCRKQFMEMNMKGNPLRLKYPPLQTSISFDPSVTGVAYDPNATFITSRFKEKLQHHSSHNIPRHRRSSSTPNAHFFDFEKAFDNSAITYEPIKETGIKHHHHRRVLSNPEPFVEELNTLPEIEPLPFTEKLNLELPSNLEYFNSIFAPSSPNSPTLDLQGNNQCHIPSERKPRPNHRKRPSGDFNDPSFALGIDVLGPNPQPLGTDLQHNQFTSLSPTVLPPRPIPTPPTKKLCATTPQPTNSSYNYTYSNENTSPLTHPNLTCSQFAQMANGDGVSINNRNDSFTSIKSNSPPHYSGNLQNQNQILEQQDNFDYGYPSTNNNVIEDHGLNTDNNITKDYSNLGLVDASLYLLK